MSSCYIYIWPRLVTKISRHSVCVCVCVCVCMQCVCMCEGGGVYACERRVGPTVWVCPPFRRILLPGQFNISSLQSIEYQVDMSQRLSIIRLRLIHIADVILS